MFRCITEVKGLAIDIDSIWSYSYEWEWIKSEYRFIFISSEPQNIVELERNFGTGSVIKKVNSYEKSFLPNFALHKLLLDIMGLKSSEMIYVTGDKDFANNAIRFLGGTVWITREKLTYKKAGIAPDLICNSVEDFKEKMHNGENGLLGEVLIYPNEMRKKGLVLPIYYDEESSYPQFYTLGRYFGRKHYMNQIHPYSTAIALNKRRNKPYTKIFDELFTDLYTSAINLIKEQVQIDAVCSVPPHFPEDDRFDGILEQIEKRCGVQNISANFKCVKQYPSQKSLSETERKKNVFGAFSYYGDLTQKNVVIIDDVITTGATMLECMWRLSERGANFLFAVVLGVNQLGGNYWSSNEPGVFCENCGKKMILLVNSNNKQFFYSCPECGFTSYNFNKGFRRLNESINTEFGSLI